MRRAGTGRARLRHANRIRHALPAAVVAVCLTAMGVRAVDAQSTGGRFGGSNWGAAPAMPAPRPLPPPPMPTPTVATSPPPMPAMPALPATPATPPMPAMPAPRPATPPPPPRVHAPAHLRPAPRAGNLVRHEVSLPIPADESNAARPGIPSWNRRGSPNGLAALFAGLVTFAVVLALVWRLTRTVPGAQLPAAHGGFAPGARAPLAMPAAAPEVALRRLSIAYDWTARAQIQSALAQLAAGVDMSSPEGMHRGALATRDVLFRALGAARYGVFQSQGAWRASAQQGFEALVDQARGRYTVETVDRARRIAGPRIAARTEEGAGLVVVTLLVATQGDAPLLPTAMSRDALGAALGAMIPPRPDLLMALEVVWSPAEDVDRMSSAELEALYPELLPLDASAALGRRVCGSCRAVYAAELGRCPACGAPPS